MTALDPPYVYLVWHTHVLTDGEEDEKLLGVYSTEARADARIALARTQPGFKDAPSGFEMARYAVDRDEWSDGFITS